MRDSPISIHALRVEGDANDQYVRGIMTDFYPRPPGGGRRLRQAPTYYQVYFYPRPPGGGRLGAER